MSSKNIALISKPIAFYQVANQALFSLKSAARFLGISPDTLADDADCGLIPCYDFHGRRTFKLEDLENLRASLPHWQNEQRPIAASSERIVDSGKS
jgi:hypothetical protein